MASGDTKTNQYLDIAANGTREDLPTDTCCETRSQTLIRGVAERIIALEEEVQELEDNPDVADIVDTYADLMAYDTSRLTDRDIIRVLNDETHNGESTYYRYSKATDSWTYIGSTGPHGGAQSDWDENDSADPAYIKNKPFYSESVESDFEQEPTTTSGSTPDTDYVWFIEQFQGYALHEVLADFNDGDTIYATITYSVNGVERSDAGKFTLTFEGSQANLDYDAPAGSRWYGAYISEVNLGDTTVRWPVLATDSGATVYITNIEYGRVKQIDAEYIPIDNDTIRVNADGELQATSSGATYIAGDGIDITNAIISATNTGMPRVLTTADYDYPDANPTGVALWRLEAGVYKITGNTKAYCYQWFNTPTAITNNSIVIVSPVVNDYVRIVEINGQYTSPRTCSAQVSSGQRINELSYFYPIVNNTLTSTSTQIPLTANQGRVLKYYIDSISQSGSGAPTTSTTGTVGQLYQDTTNGKLYICTAIVPGTDPDPDTYTWEEVGGGGVTPVQTTGTSTTDVMSQNATTSMIYADPETKEKIQIGLNANPSGAGGTAIGVSTNAQGMYGIAIGRGASARYQNSIAIGTSSYTATTASASIAFGNNAKINGAYDNSVALGSYANVTSSGQVNIGTGSNNYGYNSSPYRLLSGLYDGQSDHDAATYGQLSTAIINGGTTAPTTATVGAVGTLYSAVVSNTAHLYVCTAIDDTTDPQNPSYTWTTLV